MDSIKRLELFRFWQYADPHANCSEFVKAFLLQFTSLEEADYPVGLIPHKSAVLKHKAYARVVSLFVESSPVDYALACHIVGSVFVHVGVVYAGQVWHTGESTGTVVEGVSAFESRASTQYFIHKKLLHNGKS